MTRARAYTSLEPCSELRAESTTRVMIEDEAKRIRVEAAAFRRLVQHLQARSDVQNIDLMNLAGFCRNCLAKWYRAAAADEGVELEELAVRGHIHGMPYEEWKARTQK